jgi:hypothetical protein
MERFCGFVLRGIQSRLHPYSNINVRMLQLAHLNQIKARFNLYEELDLNKCWSKDPAKKGCAIPGCKFILLYLIVRYSHCSGIVDDKCRLDKPRARTFAVSDQLSRRIAKFLATRFDTRTKVTRKLVPSVVERWGKCVRLEGGDTMHASKVVSKTKVSRDCTFVHVRFFSSLFTPTS